MSSFRDVRMCAWLNYGQCSIHVIIGERQMQVSLSDGVKDQNPTNKQKNRSHLGEILHIISVKIKIPRAISTTALLSIKDLSGTYLLLPVRHLEPPTANFRVQPQG